VQQHRLLQPFLLAAGVLIRTLAQASGSEVVLVLLSPVVTYRPTLTCSCNPTSLIIDTSTDSGTLGSLVVTASGGSGTKTYAWTLFNESGDGSLNISSPASATTNITYLGLSYNGAQAAATAKCTVTDSLSTSTFVNVLVAAIRTSGGGSPP